MFQLRNWDTDQWDVVAMSGGGASIVATFRGPNACAQGCALVSFLNGNSFSSQRVADQLLKGEL